MSIDNLTLKEIKEIAFLVGNVPPPPSVFQPFETGQAYLIRTVTHITIGVITAVGEQELVLSNASWIADTGRYHDALKTGVEVLKEVEPYIHEVIIGRGSIVDATRWNHPAPIKQK